MALKKVAPEPVLPFATQRKFAVWLARYHANSTGVWIKIAKAASGIRSIKYAEAVETALCWGWIDSQTKGIDQNGTFNGSRHAANAARGPKSTARRRTR